MFTVWPPGVKICLNKVLMVSQLLSAHRAQTNSFMSWCSPSSATQNHCYTTAGCEEMKMHLVQGDAAPREPHLPKSHPCPWSAMSFLSHLNELQRTTLPCWSFQQQGHWEVATLSSLPPVLCWLCPCSFVSDLFGCSTGKDRMGLSFCHNDSFFFFFSGLIIVFQNNLPLYTHIDLPQTLLFILQFLYLMCFPSFPLYSEFLHLLPSSPLEIPFSLPFFFSLLLTLPSASPSSLTHCSSHISAMNC